MAELSNLSLYYLDFDGALHLGRQRIGQGKTGSCLPADSLFAALVATWVEANGQKPDRFVESFPRRLANGATPGLSTPFHLTSAFPFAGDVRFYPSPPLSYLKLAPETRQKRLKELKRIDFISEKLFEMVIQGQELEAWLPSEFETKTTDQGLYLQDKSLWLTVEEVEKLPDYMRYVNHKKRPLGAMSCLKVWEASKMSRVAVDRLRNTSNIFRMDRMIFNNECGLWFGIEWQDKSWEKDLTHLLDLLADSGLGGERAVGYGHFAWREKEARRWKKPADGDLFITLSRYHPSHTEISGALNDAEAAYSLVSVGGWLASSETSAQRRRRLWMVAEGSVLRAVGNGPWGDVTDVQPTYDFPHPVWRYGLAYPIAMETSP